MTEARRLWPLGLLGGLLFLLVWVNVQATLLGYKASAERKEADSLKARNAYLRLELERDHSPSSLEREAARRLGMKRPDPAQMVVLGAETVPGPVQPGRRGAIQLAASFLDKLGGEESDGPAWLKRF